MDRLLKFGFAFEWDQSVYNEDTKEKSYTLGNLKPIYSYNVEIAALIMLVIIFAFSLFKHLQIQNLMKVTK